MLLADVAEMRGGYDGEAAEMGICEKEKGCEDVMEIRFGARARG